VIARFPAPAPLYRLGEDRARRRPGWLLHWLPIPLGGTVTGAGYHIYSNGGSGPINYSTPIATTYALTWTSGPLSYPADWKFGVRAFNGYGEEQNLDCAVEIILDSGGNDITRRPSPPVGLRAFALAGGAIRAEWSYSVTNPVNAATGFHVYLVADIEGVLYPVTPVASTGRRATCSGSVRQGLFSAARSPFSVLPRPGLVRWSGALGSSLNYSQPAATVLSSTMIANTFVCNIPGLSDGVTYLVGVRAYNAVAEEPNTNTVSVTADATGPLPVDSLVGIAV